MFLVSDGTRVKRKQVIMRIASVDKAVGLLLSIIDFEWTVRRVILKLSTIPTKSVRERLCHCSGMEDYKNCWKELLKKDPVCKVRDSLCDVVNGSVCEKGSVRLWDAMKLAFDSRHRLVHGVDGFIKDEEADMHMHNMFMVTDRIDSYALSYGCNVFDRIKPRRKKISKEIG